MIHTYSGTITTTGTNGSASGSATVNSVNGRIVAIYLDYTNQPNTTDVTIATSAAPIKTILTRSNSGTDGWFYPRVLLQDTSAADLTTVYDTIPVDGNITVSVAQGDSAATLAFYILVDREIP
jgi:hypothetical protein